VEYLSATIHDQNGSVGGMGKAFILLHGGENDSVGRDKISLNVSEMRG